MDLDEEDELHLYEDGEEVTSRPYDSSEDQYFFNKLM